ncbi:hypothetical protein BN168_490119 [Clostridioides difficile CD002]|nr:hypothetical protein BN167_1270097 [Clostridioides difficile E13]CCL07256.1 hypothetical protein BN168_490119 [Clostridioides difficile CD002]
MNRYILNLIAFLSLISQKSTGFHIDYIILNCQKRQYVDKDEIC